MCDTAPLLYLYLVLKSYHIGPNLDFSFLQIRGTHTHRSPRFLLLPSGQLCIIETMQPAVAPTVPSSHHSPQAAGSKSKKYVIADREKDRRKRKGEEREKSL